MGKEDIRQLIIAKETAALEMWNEGNPSGYLEIYAEDITYFEPFQKKQIEGLKDMTIHYEKLRGKGRVEKYEIINPIVQLEGKIAILTYRLDSYAENTLYPWNCTEVYRLEDDNEWKVIHNHWSLLQV